MATYGAMQMIVSLALAPRGPRRQAVRRLGPFARTVSGGEGQQEPVWVPPNCCFGSLWVFGLACK
eukprot:1414380-Pyramimonas_sp.AAC.1